MKFSVFAGRPKSGRIFSDTFSKLHLVLGVLILGTGLIITGVSSKWLQEDKTNLLQELTVQVSASGSRQLAEKIHATFANSKQEANFTLTKRASLNPQASAWDFSGINETVIKVDRLKELLNSASFSMDDVFLGTVSGNQGENLVVVARLAQGRSSKDAGAILQVLVEPLANWEDLVRPFKGAFTSLFFVDEKGHTFLHPNQNYIGHVIGQNVAVQSVISAGRRLFTGALKSDSGESSFVSYERVPKTNLISVSTVPLKVAYSSAKVIMLFIMGMMTVLAAVVFFITRSQSIPREAGLALAPLEDVLEAKDASAEAAATLNAGQPLSNFLEQKTSPSSLSFSESTPFAGVAVPTAPALDIENVRRTARFEAIESLGRKLAKEFQSAIAATLGHVQLAKGKIESRDTLKHVEFIDREVRQIKETLDRMSRMGVYQTLELTSAKPLEIFSDIVDEASVMTSRWSVDVRKNFFPVSDFRIQSDEFKKGFQDLIVSRAQAMQGASRRNLIVTVEPFEDKVRIKLADHAAPLTPDMAKKFFDFGERISATQALFDLRIPTVGIILFNHGAVTHVIPEADGNTIVIDFPVYFEDKKLKRIETHFSESRNSLSNEQVNLSSDIRNLSFSESLPVEDADVGPDRLPVPPAAPSKKQINFVDSNNGASFKSVRSARLTPPPAPVLGGDTIEELSMDSEEQGPLTGFSVKVRRPRVTL